jgi:hypothetical protein
VDHAFGPVQSAIAPELHGHPDGVAERLHDAQVGDIVGWRVGGVVSDPAEDLVVARHGATVAMKTCP